MHDHRKSNSSSHLREEMHLALQKDIAVKRLPNLRRREKLPYYALTAYRAFERATTIQRISVRLDPGSETNTATISKNTSSATTVHDIIFDSTDEPHALFDPHDRCQDAGGARSAENRRGSMLKQLGVSEGSTSTLVEENGNVHDDFNNAERECEFARSGRCISWLLSSRHHTCRTDHSIASHFSFSSRRGTAITQTHAGVCFLNAYEKAKHMATTTTTTPPQNPFVTSQTENR